MTQRKKQNASAKLSKDLSTLQNHKSAPKSKSGWGAEPSDEDEHEDSVPSTTASKVVAPVTQRQPTKNLPLDVAAGERTRITHALNLMEAMIQSMRIALLDAAPIGLECPQALLTTAGNIAAHAAAADVALRLKDG